MTARRRGPWSNLRPYRALCVAGIGALMFTNVLALTLPWLLGRTIEALRGANPGTQVPRLALAMVGFAALQAVARVGSRIWLFNAARAAEYDVRNDLFVHLLKQAPSFYRVYPTGDVMSRLTSDVQTVRAMWGPAILNLVNTGFLFTVALVLMLRIDPVLSAWALLPYPALVLAGRLFGRSLFRASRAVQEYLGTMSNGLQEDLTGIGVIKTYSLEGARAKRFAGMSEELLRRNMDLTRVRGRMMPALSALAALGTVAVLWVGGRDVIAGRMTLGQLVQFNAYLALLVWPTLAFGWMLSLFQRGMASWRRLAELLETEPAIADGAGPDLDGAAIRGDLELRGLTIEIDGRKLLDGVSLTMAAGTTTAIVGRTGAGKSMLVEAIPRLLQVPEGTVFLDGRDVTELSLATLRGAIGYAPQEAFLFSRTIAENIAFGAARRRGLGVQDIPAIVDEGARTAGLMRDVAAFPDGLDTIVGERGITLSGGQRQRVALARALAAAPRVLILDDSLSSVDTETEREILSNLDRALAGRTAILISHRVAAVKRAHQIAVLDAGKIVELGSHDELLERQGLYAELYKRQLEEAAIAGEVADDEAKVAAGGGR